MTWWVANGANKSGWSKRSIMGSTQFQDGGRPGLPRFPISMVQHATSSKSHTAIYSLTNAVFHFVKTE